MSVGATTVTMDSGILQASLNNLGVDIGENRRRVTRFTEADAETRVGAQTYLHESLRLSDKNLSVVVNAGIAGQATNSVLPTNILAERAAQFQPGQATYVDPNFRAGSVAPGRTVQTTPTVGS